MMLHQKYVFQYLAKDFKGCARSVYDFINQKWAEGHFPPDYLTNIEHVVAAMFEAGFPPPTFQEFQGICHDFLSRIMKGPGNPTVNN